MAVGARRRVLESDLRGAARRYRQAHHQRDEMIRAAARQGNFTRQQIGELVGLSKARIDQILAPKK